MLHGTHSMKESTWLTLRVLLHPPRAPDLNGGSTEPTSTKTLEDPHTLLGHLKYSVGYAMRDRRPQLGLVFAIATTIDELRRQRTRIAGGRGFRRQPAFGCRAPAKVMWGRRHRTSRTRGCLSHRSCRSNHRQELQDTPGFA